MYGIEVVIPLPENNSDVVPFLFIGVFDSMYWSRTRYDGNAEEMLKKLNKVMFEQFEEEPDGYTTIDKLMTAPCDAVLMLSGETGYEYLQDRKPLDCSKGSGNEHVRIEEYIRVDKPST